MIKRVIFIVCVIGGMFVPESQHQALARLLDWSLGA